jgi:hypothetical protein
MGYVQAGYIFVLSILFLYGVQLTWRRRKLTRAVARVAAHAEGGATTATDDPGGDRQ